MLLYSVFTHQDQWPHPGFVFQLKLRMRVYGKDGKKIIPLNCIMSQQLKGDKGS